MISNQLLFSLFPKRPTFPIPSLAALIKLSVLNFIWNMRHSRCWQDMWEKPRSLTSNTITKCIILCILSYIVIKKVFVYLYKNLVKIGIFFLSYWSSGYLQGKEHKIHIDRYEYEISPNKYPAIFHDPWILPPKIETSEGSDKGKFGSNFIKVILVIWRLLKTKIFI